MNPIFEAASKKHASTSVVYHCLYGYFYLGLNKHKLSLIYNKHHSTIANWISRYVENGFYGRKKTSVVYKKFGKEMRDWIIRLYQKNPVLYLDEAKQLFQQKFGISISISSVCCILHAEGLTYKTLQRRAIQIRQSEIFHFHEEISCFPWDLSCLIFLDEVSFDNLGMLRNKGYAVRGEKIFLPGEFVRRPRISLLCFLAQSGMIESFQTEGTFTCQKFFDCCRQLALSGKCQRYPGRNSVWILDGAKIHCDANIISYLRSLGIVPIFLPPYCPMYNPIEILFGLCKKNMKRNYEESTKNLEVFVATTMLKFRNFNATKVFRKCGYAPNGTFDPTVMDKQPLHKLGFE